MIGQFFTATCGDLGLRYRSFVRNTPRSTVDLSKEESVAVDLSIFDDGTKIFDAPSVVTIEPTGYLELSAQTNEILRDYADKNLLVTAQCRKGESPGYFSQEHQVTYARADGQNYASLLYDQIPVRPAGKVGAPIVVLAPKIWIGPHTNCHVVIANSDPNVQQRTPKGLKIRLFDCAGVEVASKSYTTNYNSALTIDVKKLLGRSLAKMELFHLAAKGGDSSYVIYTLLTDDQTGNIAIEHSLPPIYYVTGDMAAVRSHALEFSP